MSYFSRSDIKAAAMGRPLSEPVKSFVALLYARLHGYSRSRAVEIINADPDAASGLQWNLAAAAHADGCETSADFEQWLQRDFCNVRTPEQDGKTL